MLDCFFWSQFLIADCRHAVDLVPREVAEQWLTYLRAELPTLAFKCSTQRQATNLAARRGAPGGKGAKAVAAEAKAKASAAARDSRDAKVQPAGAESLGVESLLQLLKNYARNADIKTAVTVGARLCNVWVLLRPAGSFKRPMISLPLSC